MYEMPGFNVDIEGSTITITCKDKRLIAQGVDDDFRDRVHKCLSITDCAEFLEKLSGAYYSAGYAAGGCDFIGKAQRISDEIRNLICG